MKAVIIAGGLGTRLRPLTDHIPKPILPLANVPFLVYKIEWLAQFGIREIILNLHHLSHKIKETIAPLEKKGVKVYFLIEKEPLGTCGAVKNAEEFFDDEPMVVCNADALTDLDLGAMIKFYKEKKARIVIATTPVDDPTRFGLVLSDKEKRITAFLEKPTREQAGSNNHINAGTYIVDPGLFVSVPAGENRSIERQFFPEMLEKNIPMYAFWSDCFWLDIGTPDAYLKATRAVLCKEVEFFVESGGKVVGRSIFGEKVEIAPGAKIGDFVAIGKNSFVGQNSRIEESILMEDVKVGKNCVLRGCILGNRCIIEDNVHIGRGVVLGDGTVITEDSKIEGQKGKNG